MSQQHDSVQILAEYLGKPSLIEAERVAAITALDRAGGYDALSILKSFVAPTFVTTQAIKVAALLAIGEAGREA
ncbi:MAG: hypothetical protein V4542_09920 [Pseudomonadota bacterium]